MRILTHFRELPASSDSAGTFTAVRLPSARRDYLAKSFEGRPIFLLHDASVPHYAPTLRARHFSAEYHRTIRIETDSGVVEGQYAIIGSLDESGELDDLFVRCVAASISSLPTSCGTREIESCVTRLLDLFQPLTRPARREIAGLWAELLTIVHSGNVADALSYWHGSQFERFDFLSPHVTIEVKSTTRSERVHEFALAQLSPSPGTEGYVLSMMLQQSGGGVGIMDLAIRVEEATAPDSQLRSKLWENITNTLGRDFSMAVDVRFDEAHALDALRVLPMSNVPRPDSPSDARVFDIRFKANLSDVSVAHLYTGERALAHLFDNTFAHLKEAK